ncbi:hypothetical protein D3C79_980840 [compost metagenome]
MVADLLDPVGCGGIQPDHSGHGTDNGAFSGFDAHDADLLQITYRCYSKHRSAWPGMPGLEQVLVPDRLGGKALGEKVEHAAQGRRHVFA